MDNPIDVFRQSQTMRHFAGIELCFNIPSFFLLRGRVYLFDRSLVAIEMRVKISSSFYRNTEPDGERTAQLARLLEGLFEALGFYEMQTIP